MKYAVAYRIKEWKNEKVDGQWERREVDTDKWIFLKFVPSDQYPLGLFGCGMKRFDDFQSADGVRIAIVVRKHSNLGEAGWPFNPDAEMEPWAASIKVVTIPDEAIAKFDAARVLLNEFDAHDREHGLRGNDGLLFKRGREVGELGREAEKILLSHLQAA